MSDAISQTTDALLDALRAEAKEYAEDNLNHGDKNLKAVLQNVYIEAYVAGGASILKKEIADRIADKYLEDKNKKKHNKKLKTAYKKAPKV